MKLWQIATGKAGRDYHELFFDHDLMVLGPSHLGDARSGQYASGRPGTPKRQVHNFAHEPKAGDRVLMRFRQEVIGVGEVPEADHRYDFDPRFRSVYGWDLRHLRRVKWATGLDLGDLATVYRKAKEKPAFSGVHESHIVTAVRDIDAAHFARPLNRLPSIDAEYYTDEDLSVELFRAGVSNKNIEDILAALRQAERLLSWYRIAGSGRDPTEHEVVSHIVLPLFLGLGWSHQQIAVEWNKVDMGFFKRTPTTEANCVMVLEAKGLEQGLGEVLHQPQNYVRTLGLENVRYIVTTNGANLFVYEKSEADWIPDPVGYLSIPSLQREYVLPKGTNLIDTLVRLQPNAV